MKKNKIVKTMLMSLTACVLLNSNFFAQESDDYDAEENTATTEEYEVQTKKNKSKKKDEFNPFDGFFTSKQASYIFYDDIPHSTGTIGYSIKHRIGTAVINPKEQKAGIQTYYQSSFFNFLFDQSNIGLISEAYEQYLKDFEEKKLIKNKTAKTRKIYSAKVKCRTEWGTVKSMMNYYGDSYVHLGYEFKDGKPYFCIIIKDCKNIAQDLGTSVPENSVEVQLYFTKAEAKRFLELIGRENVKKILAKDYFDEESEYTPDDF
ncbi:MAG: hypothetical protein J6Y36_06995 [Treponema sp.]|nr:hypothetical protein [Treponema sp.]